MRFTRYLHAGAAVFVAIASAFPQNAFAQTLGQGMDDGISLWRVAGALLLCTCFAIAGVFVLKARLGGASVLAFSLPFAIKRERRLRLIESLRLGQNAGLSIVACDGRELLVLVSESGSQVVRTLPAVEEHVGGVVEGA